MHPEKTGKLGEPEGRFLDHAGEKLQSKVRFPMNDNEDPLAPARGIAIALVSGIPFWAFVIWLACR